MDNTLLKGLWKYLMPVPPFLWKRKINQMGKKAASRVEFMTADHHRVRNFVVKTMPESANPISLDRISNALDIEIERISTIVDELEKNKFFLFRNTQGDVSWAYPVTTEKTPHRVYFSTGDKIYAA